MIQSVELLDRNDRDHKTMVREMVSFCRGKSANIPLAVVCAFARDGKSYYMHGTEEEWKKKIAAGGRERDDVLSLSCFPAPLFRSPWWHN